MNGDPREDLILLLAGLAVICGVLAAGAALSDWLQRRFGDPHAERRPSSWREWLS